MDAEKVKQALAHIQEAMDIIDSARFNRFIYENLFAARIILRELETQTTSQPCECPEPHDASPCGCARSQKLAGRPQEDDIDAPTGTADDAIPRPVVDAIRRHLDTHPSMQDSRCSPTNACDLAEGEFSTPLADRSREQSALSLCPRTAALEKIAGDLPHASASRGARRKIAMEAIASPCPVKDDVGRLDRELAVAYQVRDSAREASNRDLELKRQAEQKNNELSWELQQAKQALEEIWGLVCPDAGTEDFAAIAEAVRDLERQRFADVRNLLAELNAHQINTGKFLDAEDAAVVMEIAGRYAVLETPPKAPSEDLPND